MKDLECPYCGEWQEVDHDDGVGYEEEVAFQQTCRDCGKTYIYYTSIVYSYDPEKADCLNDGEHDFKPTHTFPKEYTKMRCSICQEERSMTQEEKEKFLAL